MKAWQLACESERERGANRFKQCPFSIKKVVDSIKH
jgi:hypothetical protein